MTQPIRLGALRLADSAPALLADAEGWFAASGLDVQLHIEPSWANLADKLAWGMLDAAIMLGPLALAAAAGLRGKKDDLVVPMGISRGGNVVVARPEVAPGASSLAAWVLAQHRRPRFAVVHAYSTHNLLLREALAGQGVDPETALEVVVVPPERVTSALETGAIDGFCAGAPWGGVAEAAGAGRVVLGSSTIRPGHAEKCLALTSFFAARPEAATLGAVLRESMEACGEAARASALARLLADRLALPKGPTRAALSGGEGGEQVQFAGAAAIPPADIEWLVGGMVRWGWIEPGLAAATAESVFARESVI